MAFLLRQISYSAEGREIVRPSRIESDRLTIGRDPSCDIHLTDLAVALHHAMIERAGADRLTVAAEKGFSIELNGRKRAEGTIELTAGGDVRIASHLLRVLPAPAGSDEVSIDVQRVEEGETKQDRTDARLFSLSSVLPSKRAAAWVFVFLMLGLFLAWPIKSY